MFIENDSERLLVQLNSAAERGECGISAPESQGLKGLISSKDLRSRDRDITSVLFWECLRFLPVKMRSRINSMYTLGLKSHQVYHKDQF